MSVKLFQDKTNIESVRVSARAGKQNECARSRSHTRSVLVPGAGLEPAQPQWSQDFKSCVSTIPPSGLVKSGSLAGLASLSV